MRQTQDRNGQGFNMLDADFGGSLVEWYNSHGDLTERQAAGALRMLRKYAKQLAGMPEPG